MHPISHYLPSSANLRIACPPSSGRRGPFCAPCLPCEAAYVVTRLSISLTSPPLLPHLSFPAAAHSLVPPVAAPNAAGAPAAVAAPPAADAGCVKGKCNPAKEYKFIDNGVVNGFTVEEICETFKNCHECSDSPNCDWDPDFSKCPDAPPGKKASPCKSPAGKLCGRS